MKLFKGADFGKNTFSITVLVIISLVINLYFSQFGINLEHDGIMFQAAKAISQGKLIYHDVFYGYGPLTAYTQFLFLKIWGNYLILIRIQTAIFYALIVIILWATGKRIFTLKMTNILTFMWILLTPNILFFLSWSTVYALFFLMLTAFLLINSLKNNKNILFILSGATAALSFWYRHDIGIYLLFFYFILLILFYFFRVYSKKILFKSLLFSFIGIIVISIPIVFLLLKNSIFTDFIYMSFIMPKTLATQGVSHFSLMPIYFLFYRIVNCLFPFSFWQFNLMFLKFPDLFWCILPFFTILQFILLCEKYYKYKIIDENERIVLILIFMSFASWLRYYPIPSFPVTYWGSAPMILVTAYFIRNSMIDGNNRIKNFNRKNIFLYLGLLFIFSLYSIEIYARINSGIYKIRTFKYEIVKPDVLKYIKVGNIEDVQSLMFCDSVINSFKKNNPMLPVITIGRHSDDFFIPFNNLIHTFPVNNEYFNSGKAMKDYSEDLNFWIIKNKPLIISNLPLTYPEYKLDTIYNSKSSIFEKSRIFIYQPYKNY